MFSYRPPKSSIWGRALQGKDLASTTKQLHEFLARYFEPFRPQTGSMDSDFSCDLHWKEGGLPNADWPEGFRKPENARCRASLCMVTLGGGSRISFPGGLTIPVSPEEQSSYEFLGRFAADAPFRMSPKHFSVGLQRARNGNLQWRKVEGNTLARLEALIRN